MPKGQRRTLSMDDLQTLIETIRGSTATKTLDTETKANLDQLAKSQLERFREEPHYWVTIHKNGEDDNIETEYLGPAGVPIYIRKEERVLLFQSAINCLKLAVIVGVDYLSPPVIINGIKYRKKKYERRFNYTVEPEIVSPEEAAQWRAKMEKHVVETQGMVPVDGGNMRLMDDLVEVGRETL